MLNITSIPSEIRQLCRDRKLDTPTPGLALGYVQANLVVLPYSLAFEFLLFCQRNPKPCPKPSLFINFGFLAVTQSTN